MSTVTLKLLLDTNVWLDEFLCQRANHECARDLFDFAEQNDISLLYASTTAKDVFFLVSSTLKQCVCEQGIQLNESFCKTSTHIAWSCVEEMAEIGFAVGCDESDLWLARKHRSTNNDFEDNLIIAAALRAEVDFIVTQDKDLLLHCPVAALTTEDVLDHLHKTL